MLPPLGSVDSSHFKIGFKLTSSAPLVGSISPKLVGASFSSSFFVVKDATLLFVFSPCLFVATTFQKYLVSKSRSSSTLNVVELRPEATLDVGCSTLSK